ncbi:class I SAM-dependent methyltransferase [Bacteroides helcogenes]|nr:class I SAM-dependent methyltransferase [Bacteroides helcogenes]MDY5237460.1 methyltransferase domain-containing protein [Bacteroides helcogenes]
MGKKGLIDRIFQNTSHPKGFWGRMILRGMNRFHAPLAQWAMSYLMWKPDGNVLDIGCGGGANLACMLQKCPHGKVYGIDISEESVTFACKRNRKQMNTRCFIRQGDVTELPYNDGQFDAVTAFETIYFWKDLPAAFAEIKRVLHQNGSLLICCEASDPGNTKWTSRIEGMTVYPANQLEALLAAAGFGEIEIHQRKKENLCIIAHNNKEK